MTSPAIHLKNTDPAGEAAPAVVAFDRVSLIDAEASESDSNSTFSLDLHAGELAAFEMPVVGTLPDLLGLTCGLVEPVCGEVRFRGTAWKKLDPAAAGGQRFSIGQVYQSVHRAQWLNNLDIDENIYLAAQMSGRLGQSDLVARADKLAKEFGLVEVPGVREAEVPRHKLMRSQWVRAFLPNPLRLLILERSTLGMHADAVELLHKKIAEVRACGTAVIWIGPALGDEELSALQPDHHFRSTPAPLLPILT